MRADHAAELKPQAGSIWIVRYISTDGHQTRHRTYLVRHYAQRFLDMLLDDGREAAMFTTTTIWCEVDE